MADEGGAPTSLANDVIDPSPGIGEHCVTDRPSLTGQSPTGEMTKLGDVDTYIAKPADYPHTPSKLLLLLTGGTGIQSKNNQLQADNFAAEGFLVCMPDQFAGDAAPNSVQAPISPANDSFLERVKLGITDTAKSFMIDMWLARHTPEKVLPRLLSVLKAAQEEFADAVANGGGVHAVGYCIGAKYVLLLAAESPGSVLADEEVSSEAEEERAVKGPLIRAGAVAHAAQVTPDDIANVKVPMYFVCVKDDPLFPEEVRMVGVERLEKAAVEHEIQVYPEVPHGFAVVGDYHEPLIQKAQAQAHEQILRWLRAH